MSNLHFRTIPVLFLAAALAACSGDVVAPTGSAESPVAPAALLGPNEFSRPIVDSTDAGGNLVSVTEFAAGVYTDPTGVSGSVASVTIRTVTPANPSSGSCITSTVLSTETTSGWKATVKKSGGCDKEIVVALENSSTRQKAEFRFLYVAGKTRIDAGAVR